MFACAARLVGSARDAGWRGIDLHDGLSWRWPHVLVATPRSRQVIEQLHVRSPIDIRAWRGGSRPRLAKTLALFARASLLATDGHAAPELTEAGREAAQALDADRAAGDKAWGYPFPVETRWSSYGANSPNVVVTAFAIDALLLAAHRLGEPAFKTRAHDAACWIADCLVARQGHIAYHEHSEVLIHNANLLGAVSVHRALGAEELVRRAVEPTLEAQRPDGSWPYGAGAGLQFVDSFHTAYVIASLIALTELHPDIRAAVERGAEYWAERFFDDRGRALMWPNRQFPEDGHSAGTALSTLALLAENDATYHTLLRRVAARALDAMMDGGHAVHRRHRWGRTRVSYIRWCDGHMALGMVAAGMTFGGACFELQESI